MIDYYLLNKALFWIKIYYEIRVLMLVYHLVNDGLDFIAKGIKDLSEWLGSRNA